MSEVDILNLYELSVQLQSQLMRPTFGWASRCLRPQRIAPKSGKKLVPADRTSDVTIWRRCPKYLADQSAPLCLLLMNHWALEVDEETVLQWIVSYWWPQLDHPIASTWPAFSLTWPAISIALTSTTSWWRIRKQLPPDSAEKRGFPTDPDVVVMKTVVVFALGHSFKQVRQVDWVGFVKGTYPVEWRSAVGVWPWRRSHDAKGWNSSRHQSDHAGRKGVEFQDRLEMSEQHLDPLRSQHERWYAGVLRRRRQDHEALQQRID